ncbi:hypothetical protein Bca101_050523 [Brassica carinata]
MAREFIGDPGPNSRSPRVFRFPFVARKGTAMMKPRSSLPRVASSLWRVGTFLGVRSKKQRSGAGPSESMDSSGSSLDLTAEVENPSRAVTGVASLSPEIDRFLPVGPLSSIGVEEVGSWRVKYHLADDVIIRISGPVDRVSDFEADERSSSFAGGEGVGGIGDLSRSAESSLLENLIALQNLGDLEGLTIRVAEVLYSYAITPLNGGGTDIPSARRRAPGSGDCEEGEKASPGFRWSLDREVCLYVPPGFLHSLVHSRWVIRVVRAVIVI